MAQPIQTSLDGANATTSTPQSGPPQMAAGPLNPNKMDSSVRNLQTQGMGLAQSVAKAASNPNNGFAKGGVTQISAPPTPDDIASKLEAVEKTPDFAKTYNAMADEGAMKDLPKDGDKTKSMLDAYRNKDWRENGAVDTGKPAFGGMAKGGPVGEGIKNMPLKDIIKLLATHPELAGKDPSQNAMRDGGPIQTQLDAEENDNSNGDDDDSDPLVQMDTGGALEEDNITGYNPDGTPIIQNADGSTGEGDVNSLLGRPKSAPTLGTGEDPSNKQTENVANLNEGMAKGGAEAPPPGALKEEVADQIPARLSPGEFVFSADSTRYYGLRLLTALQDHARDQLASMADKGGIRSPGDGKDGDSKGLLPQFMQDEKPNMNAYDKPQSGSPQGDDMVSGLLKECMGGGTYSQGGLSEDSFRGGGSVTNSLAGYAEGGDVATEQKNRTPTFANPNMAPAQGMAKGGIVGADSSSLTPKKSGSLIPMSAGPKAPRIPGLSLPRENVDKVRIPKMKKGGLLRDPNQDQSYTGA